MPRTHDTGVDANLCNNPFKKYRTWLAVVRCFACGRSLIRFYPSRLRAGHCTLQYSARAEQHETPTRTPAKHSRATSLEKRLGTKDWHQHDQADPQSLRPVPAAWVFKLSVNTHTARVDARGCLLQNWRAQAWQSVRGNSGTRQSLKHYATVQAGSVATANAF